VPFGAVAPLLPTRLASGYQLSDNAREKRQKKPVRTAGLRFLARCCALLRPMSLVCHQLACPHINYWRFLTTRRAYHTPHLAVKALNPNRLPTNLTAPQPVVKGLP
jgi:hypothetical protein